MRKQSEKLNLNNSNNNHCKHATAQQQKYDANSSKFDELDEYINNRHRLHHNQHEHEDCIVKNKKVTFSDFSIIKLIGKGSFGKVFLVTSKQSPINYYAMKALKKDVILQNDDVECTMLERDVCQLGNSNPFLAKLYVTFQNEVIYLY